MQPVYITRAGVLGTLIVLVVAGVCIRLGIWQLDRYDERQAHNAAVAARMAERPLTVDELAGDTAGLLYRTVELAGEFDDARALLLHGRSFRGATGAHVVTPLPTGDGGAAVLVNRGWVPAANPDRVDLASLAGGNAAGRRGVVLPLPRTDDTAGGGPDGADTVARETDERLRRVWYRLDAGRLDRALPYRLSDVYVQLLPGAGGTAQDGDAAQDEGTSQDESIARGGRTPRVAGYPRTLPPPEPDEGPHLGYAIQWFSFAATALIGWTVLAIRRGEVGRRAAATDD